MQTIILTDNKRLSTDYYADKTIFAQKIDVNHILNTEVYQSHISRARFWTIRTNIYNEENLVHQLCKNLVNRGSMIINFEFSITKIAIGQELAYNDQKRSAPLNEKYMKSSRVSGYVLPNPVKTISFPQFMNSLKTNSHTKTTSGVEWPHQSEYLFEEQKKNSQKQASCQKKDEELVTLKPLFKKEFEVSSLSELSAIFMSKEGIFDEFGMREEVVMKSKRIITTYIFRQNDIEIGLSVVSEGCKKYIQKAINIEISEAFNIQFKSRKQVYESTSLTENFSGSNIPKSNTKISHEIQKQTYHKILLFLFSHYDPDGQKTKVSSSNLSQSYGNKEISKFIQAIQAWKMKDEDINITQKFSKEYVLIKQEVENEKVSFKNKLKIFEAIIGESVNVDKLLNEEKEMEISNTNPSIVNAQQKQAMSAIPQNSRISRKSELKSMLNSPQQMAVSSTNSEFKRLKQSFEMIRNIDNIINEQNKKIETLKLYQKQIFKSKNQILYKSVKALNQVKKQIKEVKDEIEQKKIQSLFRNQKLENEKNGQKRNFVPSPEAQKLLELSVKIFKKIILNEKSSEYIQNYLLEDGPMSNNKPTGKQNKQRLSHNYCNQKEPENKKSFSIRKQTSSLTRKNTQYMGFSQHLQLNQSRGKAQPYQKSILSTLYKCEKEKQFKLMKKRREQVENNRIWLNVQKQKNTKPYQEKSEDMSNHKEKDILLMLYQYFLKNNQLISEVNCELSSYHTISNPRMSMTFDNSSKSQIFSNMISPFITRSIHTEHRPLNTSTSQLNLRNKNFSKQSDTFFSSKFKYEKDNFPFTCQQIDLSKFPLLNNILNPKISQSALESEECSIISDSLSENENIVETIQKGSEGKQRKRVTIQNMVQRK